MKIVKVETSWFETLPDAMGREREMGVKLTSDLDVLREASDFVSLHCRLEKHTRRLLSADRLKRLKPTAQLINAARGEMIDEIALLEALREHRIAGAGLDVFETKPLPLSSPLLSLDNVILTPDWLPSTTRAAETTSDIIFHNLVRVATGHRPQNVLNPEVLPRLGFIRKVAQFEENRQNG